MPERSGGGPKTLAEKLDHLFKTVYPGKRGEYSYREVASAIEAQGGPTISASYLHMLRHGGKTNPTKRHIEALAKFFGVPPGYFFDDEEAGKIDAQLQLLAALRDAGVGNIALRAAGLSPRTLEAVARMVESARELDGIDDPDEPNP